MSDTTHIIPINAPYIKYKTAGKIHIFTAKLTDLVANQHDHEYNDRGEVFYLLYNPITEKGALVKLKSGSLVVRVYENDHDPEKIIQLIIS